MVYLYVSSKHHGMLQGDVHSECGEDGFTYDFAAHFINSRLAASLGISDRCLPMPTYEEAFWFNKKRYSYPFGLMASPTFAVSALKAKIRFGKQDDPKSLTEYFRRPLGVKLAIQIAIPLVEAWSGAPGTQLSPSVASKLSTGLVQTIWLRFAAWASNRTVAIGYSQEVGESAHVHFVYPKGGIGAVCEGMAEEIENLIQTESPIPAVFVENEKVVGIRVRGEDITAAAVNNTAPLPILAKLIQGSKRFHDERLLIAC